MTRNNNWCICLCVYASFGLNALYFWRVQYIATRTNNTRHKKKSNIHIGKGSFRKALRNLFTPNRPICSTYRFVYLAYGFRVFFRGEWNEMKWCVFSQLLFWNVLSFILPLIFFGVFANTFVARTRKTYAQKPNQIYNSKTNFLTLSEYRLFCKTSSHEPLWKRNPVQTLHLLRLDPFILKQEFLSLSFFLSIDNFQSSHLKRRLFAAFRSLVYNFLLTCF